MTKHAFSFAALGLLFSVQASASTFQHQVTLGQSGSINDFSDGIASVSYDYFLTPVDAEKGPYQLADFLSQSSKASIALLDIEETDVNQLYGRYVFDNKWFFSLMHRNEYGDADTQGGELGYYWDDYTKLTFSYEESSRESNLTNQYGHHRFDHERSQYKLQAEKYLPFADEAGLFLAASFSLNDFDSVYNVGDEMHKSEGDDKLWHVSTEYFLNQSLSFVANYSYADTSFQSSDDDFSVGVNYWWQFSKNFSAKAMAAESLSHGGNTFVNLALTARF